MEKLVYQSYNDLSQVIRSSISIIQKEHFELIVGTPRSGMVPAYMIATYLNLDVTDYQGYINNVPLQRGITRSSSKSLTLPQESRKTLIVDDSIFTGQSIAKKFDQVPDDLKSSIRTLVVYKSGNPSFQCDFYLKKLNGVKLFEWSLFHNRLVSQSCIDLDGVICNDPTLVETSTDSNYRKFIETVEPQIIPSGEVYAIVTNRLEKYRDETEQWLTSNSVRYKNLFMLNVKSKLDRDKIDAAREHKARVYKELDSCSLFIESSYNQSLTISKYSGKPVFSYTTNELIYPSVADEILHNRLGFVRRNLIALKHQMRSYKISNR